MATVGGLVNIDNSITQTVTTLTANQVWSVSYQWINCDTRFTRFLELHFKIIYTYGERKLCCRSYIRKLYSKKVIVLQFDTLGSR